MIEINGVAHVILTVSDWERARPFYRGLLAFLGLKPVFEGEDFIYFVGGRTAIGIERGDPRAAGQRFRQGGVGLHHLSFRARARGDVDQVHAYLKAEGAAIVRGPEEGAWAPGYYSLLFEDPDGIRLEINHVPGKGVLAQGAGFDPAGDYR